MDYQQNSYLKLKQRGRNNLQIVAVFQEGGSL